MTTRKRAPTPEDRAFAFARLLPFVVDAIKAEVLGDPTLEKTVETTDLLALAVPATVEFVKGADLGNDAGSR